MTKQRTSALFALLAAFAVLVSGAVSPLTPQARADEPLTVSGAEGWGTMRDSIEALSSGQELVVTLGSDIAYDGSQLRFLLVRK